MVESLRAHLQFSAMLHLRDPGDAAKPLKKANIIRQTPVWRISVWLTTAARWFTRIWCSTQHTVCGAEQYMLHKFYWTTNSMWVHVQLAGDVE